MGILRKDYILDRWVYYATGRKKRPKEFKSMDVKNEVKNCLFCPSNEHLTPSEIGRVEYKGSWKIRWFLNKFPAVEKKGSPSIISKKFISEGKSYGVHEIIVETDHHRSQLADLPYPHIKELLEVYRLRINSLGKLNGIRYVEIFKNHGKDAGTSLVHSHSQVMALTQVPRLVLEEADAAKKSKKCPYCAIIKMESRSRRKIFETKNVVVFAPFASRFNYEAWIFPKQHKTSMSQLEEGELNDIALALKKILVKLKKINASYSLFIHYSPSKENLHLHIEITPRLAAWGGFEISTEAIINSVLPEDAARFYRK